MSNGRSLPQSWPGLSAAARLRLVLPEIEAWAREYGSHDVIVADLADRGLVVSKALLRKELLKYRRKLASMAAAGSSAAPSADASQARTVEDPKPAGLAGPQNLEALATKPARGASTEESRTILGSRWRSSVADEFMHVYATPRLGRKKREEEDRAKSSSPEPD